MIFRVLILGGTGFIGRRLAASLARTDWATPIIASRHAPKTKDNDAITHIAMDATDCAAIQRELTSVDAIVNCVTGNTAAILANAQALFRATQDSTHPIKTIYLSSISAYGSATGTVKESAQLLGDLDGYSSAKANVETAAARLGNVTCLRAGIVYGPGSSRWSELIGQLLMARRLGDLGAAGDGYCNLTYVDDLIQCILQLLQKPDIGSQAFNICSPEQLTWNDYFIRYAKALGAVPVKRIGSRRLKLETKLLALPLKVAETALGTRRARRLGIPAAIPPSFARLCRQEIIVDSAAATRVLEMEWTRSEDGLRPAANWLLRKEP